MGYPYQEALDYSKAAGLLGSRASKKLAHNTYLVKSDDGKVAVRYHKTNVLTYCPDGAVILNSGGWRTSTTKARFGWYLPMGFQVWQEKSVWYLGQNAYLRDREGAPKAAGSYLFEDGARILPNGAVEGADLYDKEAEKKAAREKRQAAAYCKAFLQAFLAGKVPAPSVGDCWGCCMVADDGWAPMGGRDHILQHMEARYFVPSLLARAVKRYANAPAYQQVLALFWDPKVTAAQRAEHLAYAKRLSDTMQRALYRMVKAEWGLAA